MARFHKKHIFAQNASKPEEMEISYASPLWKSPICPRKFIWGPRPELGVQSWATLHRRSLVGAFLYGHILFTFLFWEVKDFQILDILKDLNKKIML